MNDKVILIRTIAGEYFIGFKKVETESQDPADAIRIKMATTITDPRAISSQMTPEGPRIVAAPVVPFATKDIKEISIPKSMIICEVEEEDINEQIVKGYKSEVSGIIVPKTPKIVTP